MRPIRNSRLTFYEFAGSWSTHGTKQTPVRLVCDPTRHEPTPGAHARSNRIVESVKRRRLGRPSAVVVSRDMFVLYARGGELQPFPCVALWVSKSDGPGVLRGVRITIAEASFNIYLVVLC
jgi:hypothetical protein